MNHIFFIHSSVDGQLGFLHVLAIADSVIMKIGVSAPFLIRIFSRYVLRNGIEYGHFSGTE